MKSSRSQRAASAGGVVLTSLVLFVLAGCGGDEPAPGAGPQAASSASGSDSASSDPFANEGSPATSSSGATSEDSADGSKKTPKPIIVDRSPDADKIYHQPQTREEAEAEAIKRRQQKPFKPIVREDGLIALNEQQTVLMDKEKKQVLLKTKVVQQDVQLEMFCCLTRTKEHESILVLDGEARAVHTALLAIGAEPGTPAKYDEKGGFTPPTGPEVKIDVVWKDAAGEEHRQPAQSWIRHVTHRYFVVKMDKLPDGVVIPENSDLRYDTKHHELTWYGPMKPEMRDQLKTLSADAGFQAAIDSFYEQGQSREMEAKFVFVGSGFHKDRRTGIEYYMAEGGYLICVANFGTALIDVAANSSEADASLLFESYEERIPPIDTEVTIELTPVPPEKAPENAAEKKPE